MKIHLQLFFPYTNAKSTEMNFYNLVPEKIAVDKSISFVLLCNKWPQT